MIRARVTVFLYMLFLLAAHAPDQKLPVCNQDGQQKPSLSAPRLFCASNKSSTCFPPRPATIAVRSHRRPTGARWRHPPSQRRRSRGLRRRRSGCELPTVAHINPWLRAWQRADRLCPGLHSWTAGLLPSSLHIVPPLAVCRRGASRMLDTGV